ncbi:MAG: ribonuclease R [Nitrospirota bacterium]|nr:ribonuclease R [Nitrospirota bacterium]
MIDKESVLKFFSTCSHPLSFKEAISQMGLDRKEARHLRNILQGLVKSGELIMTRQGRYGTPEEMSLVKGYFEAHRDGYGFVIPEDPGQRDVFVPSKATLGAMEGDRVIVRIENPKKRDGRILRILERAQTRLVGTLEITKGVSFLRPKRRDIPFDIYIAPKDRKNAKNGDMVVAEILTYPTDKRPPSGKVIKMLKKPEIPAEEVESIIDEFNLPRKFPADVTKEAKSLSAEIPDDMPGRRKDLQKLPTVTIDGERAKDFDDAISIKLRKFGYTLYVHIADVGYYVPWESVIDREAKKRGTSVYLPDRVVPMLPKKLSEDICSLKPKVPRFAFTVEMDFSRDGVRINQRFYPSIIRSDERMTYTQVKEILVDEDRKLRKRYDYLLKEFELMEELCGVMRERRLKRGSLDFDLPEPEVLLDIRGNPEAIVVAERNFAHMIIEEFMIAANETVAENLSAMGVPSIYRIHEPPDQSKMDDILKVVKAVTNIRKKHLNVKDLPYILEKVRGRPEEDVVNYIVLRSLKQARYSIQNVGHFGLASECYTHFTSPIRRYSDLVVHRILREVLGRKKMKDERMKELEEALPSTAFHCSRRERIADDAERAVVAAMRAWFMKGKVGEELVARIVGVTPQGIKVRLKDFYVDGFLHVSYLTDDYYIYNERNLQLVGRRKKRRFSIGDEITVRVDKVDLDQREIIFGLPRT